MTERLHPHCTGLLVAPNGDVIDAGIIIFDPERGLVVHHGPESTDVVYTAALYPEVGVLPAPPSGLN